MAVATETQTNAQTTRNCYRCGGSGIYRWGAVVNGVSTYQGVCFRCGGSGIDPKSSTAKREVVNPDSAVLKSWNDLAKYVEETVKTGTEEQARGMRDVLAYLITNGPVETPYYGPNVYAALIESADRVIEIRFGSPEPETDPEPEPETPAIPNGTYTIETEDGHFTFRLKEGSGKLSGKTIIEYLYGPDNELDFRAFGFMKADGTIQVWTRFRHNTVGTVRVQQIAKALSTSDTVEKAGQAYALMSGRCRRCGRTLTVPASIHRGYGPDCAGKIQ